MKRNHFADVRHYVEGYDPTSGIFRRLTHPILGWLPHPILDWAIITEKPGLTERNFPLSAGLKIRLSDPAGTMPTSGDDILQVIY